jgi:hypothetical protein
MTLRFVARAISCAGVLSLAGCQFGAADRINAALPPGDEIIAARESMFNVARAQKLDAPSLDAEFRARMERRALDCAKGYTPGVFDGNDQIRERLTDKACFATADARLVEWLHARRSAMIGEPRMPPREVMRASDARVVVEPHRTIGAQPARTPQSIAAPEPTIGVNAVPSTPRPLLAHPPSDINATRRAMIERSIRENDVSPEAAAAMRKWVDDIEGKSQASAPPAARASEPSSAGLIDVPPDARVLAIGIYEAADGEHSFNGPRKAGTVQVFVMKSARPVVLVLSSYEPVNWNLQLQDGAKVSHVLLSGYHASQVFGARDASIESIGTQYAYQRGSPQFETLDGLVQRFTGKRIGSFQGAYSGGSFTLN